MTHPLVRNYFDSEAQQLFDSIVAESIQFGGIECYYVPNVIEAVDKLLNEAFLVKYKEAYKVSVFREEVGGFFPNDFFVQKFGAEFSGANTIFAASKSDWTKITGEQAPNIGGLLVFPDVKQIYEIRGTDTRDPWISGGKIYYWKLQCLPFEYSAHTKVTKDIFDFVDETALEVLDEFLEDNNIYDAYFFTADSTCVYASSTKHLASEDLRDDYFLPVTADREDVWAGEDDWFVDIDWKKINSGNGPQTIVNLKHGNYALNGVFSEEAKKYNVTDNYGFS